MAAPVVIMRVDPSAGILATCSAASIPLAPGLLSTSTVTPSLADSPDAKCRAITSCCPPGWNATTMRITLGKSCANAAWLAPNRAADATSAFVTFITTFIGELH